MRTYVVLFLLLSLLVTSQIFAHENYIGRSGAPGRNTCASSCHGNSGGTVTISNFPTSYIPGQIYTVTIKKTSGDNIENFNSSVRIGTGSVNAGVIAAGSRTAVYNTTGETNGVHLATASQDTATFLWTAPAAGTGPVRLYTGAFQGVDPDLGFTSASVLVANEAAALPSVATLPSPFNDAVGVVPAAALSWTAGSGATSHDVYFGSSNPPPFVGNQATTLFDPPGDMTLGTVYYWRIDERNAAGATPGAPWNFTTLNPPVGRCCYPDNTCAMVTQTACASLSGLWDAAGTCASPCALEVPQALVIRTNFTDAMLSWRSVTGAQQYRIYRSTSSEDLLLPANVLIAVADTFFVDTGAITLSPSKYYYAVEAYNP